MIRPPATPGSSGSTSWTSTRSAAIRAGYSPKTAKQQGSRLLTKVDVAAAVQRGIEARSAQTRASAVQVLGALAAIAFSDVRDYLPLREGNAGVALEALTPRHTAALAGVTVTARTEGEGEAAHQVQRIHVRLADKLVALTMLAQHLGLFQRPAGGRKPRIAARLADARERVQVAPAW